MDNFLFVLPAGDITLLEIFKFLCNISKNVFHGMYYILFTLLQPLNSGLGRKDIFITDCVLTMQYCGDVLLIIILCSGLFIHALFDNILEQWCCFYSFVLHFFRLRN